MPRGAAPQATGQIADNVVGFARALRAAGLAIGAVFTIAAGYFRSRATSETPIATLGLGAYLTIKGELSAGAIIAASVASARALAPVD